MKEIANVVKEEITRVFLGEKNPEEALSDMKARCDELIKKAAK